MQLETLGDFLRKTRQSKGWELKDIEKKIKISERYLNALEENDYYKLPIPTYTRGFLERYAEFLELDVKSVIERYRQENRFSEAREKALRKNLNKASSPGFHNLLKGKKITSFDLEKFGIFIIFIVFSFYLIWIIGQAVLPPKITIFFPPDNFETKEKIIQVKGQIIGEAVVKINGQIISKIEKGNFEETIDLATGINSITISAKKKYSPETIIQRRIIVKE